MSLGTPGLDLNENYVALGSFWCPWDNITFVSITSWLHNLEVEADTPVAYISNDVRVL